MIHKARLTAQQLHSKQIRKSGGLPYFSHLDNVARLVSQFTTDQDIIAAAYLHDTIEDTSTTYNDLKNQFNTRVAKLVQSVSKTSHNPDQYLTNIDNPDSALIAGCDKVDNSKDLNSVTDWSVFNYSKTDKIAQYKKVSQVVRKYHPAIADMIDKNLLAID